MEKSYPYTGKPIKPPFALNIEGKTLVQGEDYRIEILDNINVGTAHVYITGMGEYTGKYEYTFEIEPIRARTLSFFADSNVFQYDGKPKSMNIVVRFGEMTLEEGKDYDIEYENNISPGKASALLTFKGNFTGVMSIPFTIKNTLPELVNTSTVSSETINFGETVTLNSSAEGGMGKYLYAVVYKKNTDKKWTWVQALSEETSVEIKPARKAEYTICSKVKDETGNVAKKFFKVSVK
jgi:hypothetical protein